LRSPLLSNGIKGFLKNDFEIFGIKISNYRYFYEILLVDLLLNYNTILLVLSP